MISKIFHILPFQQNISRDVYKNTQGPFKALREKPFMEACKQEGEKRKDKEKEEEREKGGELSEDGAAREGESDV